MIRLRIGCQRAKLQPARGVLDFWKPKINIWEIESEREKGERSEEKRKRSAALLSGAACITAPVSLRAKAAFKVDLLHLLVKIT